MKCDSGLSIGLLLFAAVALGSCGFGTCPEVDPSQHPLKSGTYQILAWAGSSPPPYRSGDAVIDVGAGTATFTFRRDGKQVVEVWRLAKVR